MVEERITDGKRIGQLLASELTGLETGPLSAVDVVDADPDAEPTDAGTVAFTIEHEGRAVGTASITPTAVRVRVPGAPATVPDREDVAVERTDEGTVVIAKSGAAVKSVVDVLVELLDG